MPILKLSDMTWEELRDLDKGNVVAILAVGAMEAHGPHLPLATDVVISEAMVDSGAEKLLRNDRLPLLLPTLVYTPAVFGAGFPGTISLTPETLTDTLVGIARSLARHRVAVLAIANSHLDPANLAAIHGAAEVCREESILGQIFPDWTRRPWASRLTEEFKSGACHAGRFEGSVVMAARPDLVRGEIQASLAPNPASLSVAIRSGKETFDEAGGKRAYFGYPAEATVEEGERTIETLGSILFEATLAAGSGSEPGEAAVTGSEEIRG